MPSFTTPAPIHTTLHIPAGRIALIAADRTETTVEIRPADPGKSRDVKAAAQVSVEYGDGVLRIAAAEPKNQYLGPTGAVEVTVQLPAGSRIDAKAASCELRAAGRLGEVAFDGAYKQIKLDEASSLRLTAVDGDVQVGRLTGPAQITTARGTIHITEATRGTLQLRTGMGDIEVGAATGASASLDAHTGHGRIGNALRNDGTTTLQIHATTGQGDITAHSL